jgi:hypothetical protein
MFDEEGTLTLTTPYSEEWLDRITRLIEQYRATKRRQLLQQAFKKWRRADAIRRRARLLHSPPEPLH